MTGGINQQKKKNYAIRDDTHAHTHTHTHTHTDTHTQTHTHTHTHTLSLSLSLSLSFSLFLIYKKYIFKSLYLKHLSSLSIYKKEDILEQSLDVCPRLLLFSVFIQKSAQSIKPDRKLWGQWEESI